MTAVLGIVGWKASGKTTLAARLIAELTRRGRTVASVKHSHHPLAPERPGTDTWRHRQAGARQVALLTPAGWALDGVPQPGPPATLDTVLARLAACDLVLVEGLKRAAHGKIECRRAAAADRAPLAGEVPGVVAIAADGPAEGGGLPVFPLDAIPAIADFVEAYGRRAEARDA
ncbi:molybdopterin-guanine dinucleotide biosynthesis protein B [Aquibium sp. A9E412]|uniref:molybdopterin-guanine dinucleotide biosynthesis protein B n=1 Tax=Aquibium sp. A9E412 TaxID=2976767 RepID=UPI0025AF03D6|nr:molybdopterin-guanine dinucleotide biosynthesis protein B [Aquibium sp. A9E412]MDN2567662.1 molybdopterin-guanine dinucleotide biosynthesis protein B [Aquibium sp. A9E412]